MSNHHTKLAWRVRGLTGTEKLVLMRLADRASKEKEDFGQCFPGQTSLAADCCLTTRTVRDAIDTLLKAGHLRIVNPATFSRSATYLVTPLPPEGDSGGEADSTPENGSGPSGNSFLSPPEGDSGPLRKELPPNLHSNPQKNPQRTSSNIIAPPPQGSCEPRKSRNGGGAVQGVNDLSPEEREAFDECLGDGAENPDELLQLVAYTRSLLKQFPEALSEFPYWYTSNEEAGWVDQSGNPIQNKKGRFRNFLKGGARIGQPPPPRNPVTAEDYR